MKHDVIETTKKILAQWGPQEEEEGYVVALPAEHNNPLARVRFFKSLHVQQTILPHEGIVQVLAASEMRDAALFTDFEAAQQALEDCERHWGRPEGIAILHIKRRPPFELVREHPITILDALVDAR